MLSERIAKIMIEGLAGVLILGKNVWNYWFAADLSERVSGIMPSVTLSGEDWRALRDAADTFEKVQMLYEVTESETPEELEVLRLAIEKAKTPEDLQWVWKRAYSGSEEEADAWKLLWETSKTYKQWKWIWKNTDVRSLEHQKAWAHVKELSGDLLSKVD